MQNLILRYVAFFLVAIFFQNCKNDDPQPDINIVGDWLVKSNSGNITFGTKSYDVNDKSAPLEIDIFYEILFNPDGTGESSGEPFTYKVSGNTVTVSVDGVDINYQAEVGTDQLTLKLDETGAKNLIEVANTLVTPAQAISKLNKVTICESLSKVITTNGTPECLLNESKIKTTASGSVTESSMVYLYNREKKVKEIKTTVSGETSVTTYEEYKENLGSESEPYVLEKVNGKTRMKYYCDINGRVNYIEQFQVNDDSRLISTIKYKYNTEGYLLSQTAFVTGNTAPDIIDYEYTNGNRTREYFTFPNGVRYLRYENSFSSDTYKADRIYIYNTGKSNTNYVNRATVYNSSNAKVSEGVYSYKFDNKRNLTERKYTNLTTSAESITTSVYTCP